MRNKSKKNILEMKSKEAPAKENHRLLLNKKGE